MNSYTTVETLRGPGVLDIREDRYDVRLRTLVESVSRQVDGYCNRHFFVLHAARTFDGDGSGTLRVPDLVSIVQGGLKTDDDRDRKFETSWKRADYILTPTNADPTGGHDASSPYTAIVVDAAAGGRTRFPAGVSTVRVSGSWGYRLRLSPAGELAEDVDDVQTLIPVASPHALGTGHTLEIGAEQVYVTRVSGDSLEVERGVNGTLPESHLGGDRLYVHRYPGPISEAVMLQVARLWRRRDASFASAGRFPGDSRTTLTGLDPDVRQLIAPYRKLVTGVV